MTAVVIGPAPGGGGGGGGTAPYVHTQSTPAASVPITHNLGYFPNVTCVDLDTGQVLDTDIAYGNASVLTLTFGAPTRFVAYLS